jgi:hypothetical protein
MPHAPSMDTQAVANAGSQQNAFGNGSVRRDEDLDVPTFIRRQAD